MRRGSITGCPNEGAMGERARLRVDVARVLHRRAAGTQVCFENKN